MQNVLKVGVLFLRNPMTSQWINIGHPVCSEHYGEIFINYLCEFKL